ncbi:tetratricopeptide repeat protein [Acidipila sp. EB88]|uniref:tetratricopeptide repeat protein n=1 Tax=Acidipila sp. EB88 TaxID=2305226 RepID=UPI000F5FCD06|nr:tetratricopeptide repeat protein [Acidipila sp. EB88]RRA49024.1 sel1 repeat family protein [Acidipila sp. EB88]
MVDQLTDTSLDLVRAAALRGVHQAQLLYGQMLLDGTCVERNQTAALHWFERAARGGNLMAINMVGRCLDQGWGIQPSALLAEPWFRKAAERGLDWGMYNLATLLTLGEGGIVQDKTEAFLWLRKAADLGHAKSMNVLGGFYEDGWVAQASRSKARDLYRKAALGGDFRGQFNYARLLMQEGDLLGALHWLQQVPATATPAFLSKMRAFLATQPHAEIRALSRTPDPSPHDSPLLYQAHAALEAPPC